MVTLKIKDIYVYMYGCFYFSERTTTVGILTGRPCEESTSSATSVRSCRHLNISTFGSFILHSLLRIFIFRVRKEKGKLFYKTEYTQYEEYTSIYMYIKLFK